MRDSGGLQRRGLGQEWAIIGLLKAAAILDALCAALRTRTNWVFVAAVVKNARLTPTFVFVRRSTVRHANGSCCVKNYELQCRSNAHAFRYKSCRIVGAIIKI